MGPQLPRCVPQLPEEADWFALPVSEARTARTALRTAAEGCPHWGDPRATRDSNFFFLAGQGGYGFQTAPAASNLLKDLIMGLPNDLEKNTIKRLDPKRFN